MLEPGSASALIIGFIVFYSAYYFSKKIGTYGLTQMKGVRFGEMIFTLFKLFLALGLITVFLPPFNKRGIVANILSVYLPPEYPSWMHHWLSPPYGMLASGLLLGFIIGRKRVASTYYFNKGRLIYESNVRKYGYWFDNPWTTKENIPLERSISMISELYAKTSQVMKEEKESDPKKGKKDHCINWAQQKNVFHYQMALFVASIGEYSKAFTHLLKTEKYFSEYKSYSDDLQDNYMETESQIAFLKGEVLYKLKDIPVASKCFELALSIDKKRNDRPGINIINKHLELCRQADK